jgi:hypothetical protein
MFTSEAHVETDRPERYLAQICEHAAAMGRGGHQARVHGGHPEQDELDVRAEWSGARGTVTFAPAGTCTLRADGTVLTLRIEATDPTGVRRIQEILSRDLDRFGRRDDLVVTWQDLRA